MSRSSCRENQHGHHLTGYFRGAREFFPEGTFEEPRIGPIYSYGCGLTHGTCVDIPKVESEPEPRPALTPLADAARAARAMDNLLREQNLPTLNAIRKTYRHIPGGPWLDLSNIGRVIGDTVRFPMRLMFEGRTSGYYTESEAEAMAREFYNRGFEFVDIRTLTKSNE